MKREFQSTILFNIAFNISYFQQRILYRCCDKRILQSFLHRTKYLDQVFTTVTVGTQKIENNENNTV